MIRVLGFKQTLRPNGSTVDWVNFTAQDGISETGEPSFSTWAEIARITPPEVINNDDGGLKMAALRSQWQQIEPHYSAWKSGQQMPETGTPIGVWPAISADEAQALRTAGFKTVQQIAEMSEAQLMRPVLPRMRDLQRQAKGFLDGMGAAELRVQIAQLQEQNAQMLEMLAEKRTDDAKRGPGRPRKAADQEEDAA